MHVVHALMLADQEILGVVAGSAGFEAHLEAHFSSIPHIGPGHADWATWVLELGPFDLFISALNLKKIPEAVIQRAAVAAINFHDALLPRHAGLFAPQMAIAVGDMKIGVTWHKLTSDWDTGDVLMQSSCDLSVEATAAEAQIQLLELGRSTFDALLPKLLAGEVEGRQQDLQERSYVRLTSRPGFAMLVQPSLPVAELHNWVRSTQGDPDRGVSSWGCVRLLAGEVWYEVLAVDRAQEDLRSSIRSVRRCSDGHMLPGLPDDAPIASLSETQMRAFAAWMESGYRLQFAMDRQAIRFGRPAEPRVASPVRRTGLTWQEAICDVLMAAARAGQDRVHFDVERPASESLSDLQVPHPHALLRRRMSFAVGWAAGHSLSDIFGIIDQQVLKWVTGLPFPKVAWTPETEKAPWTLIPEDELHWTVVRPADPALKDSDLRQLWTKWAKAPATNWPDLPRLTDAEVHQLEEWETGMQTAEAEDFVVTFWRRAREQPEAPAVELPSGEVWTCGMLADRVAWNLLAWQKQGLEIQSGQTSMLSLPRSPELLVAQLSILTCGGVFASVHEKESPERLAAMISVSESLWGWRSGGGEDGFWHAPAPLPDEVPHDVVWPAVVEPPGLACILFTSGTTGPPKAVEVTRRGLSNHLDFIVQRAKYGVGQRALITASPAFDGILEEMFASLISGAIAVFPTPEAMRSMAAFGAEVDERAISMLCTNTLLWLEWVRSSAFALPLSVRSVNVGGDRLDPTVLEKWWTHVKAANLDVTFLNGYGPTEASVTCTTHLVSEEKSIRPEGVPIGRPEWNVEIRLVDENHHRVPPGHKGQILVAGRGLARGYRNNPEQTAAKFITLDKRKWYATGDFGRWDEDGELLFLGRMDQQVKYRGHRLEILEVEAALMKLPSVSFAFAHFLPRQGGGLDQLVAFLHPMGHVEDSSDWLKGLRDEVGRHLPTFLQPSHHVFLPDVPKTSSGKPDRSALAALAQQEARPAAQALEKTGSDRALEIVANVLGRSSADLDLEASFRDHGGDSLAAMLAQQALEEDMGRQLPLGGLHGDRPLQSLWSFLNVEDSDTASSVTVVSRPNQPIADAPWWVATHNLFGYPCLQNLWPLLEDDLPICTLRFGHAQKAWLDRHPEADLSAYAALFVQDILKATGGRPMVLAGSSFGAWFAWHLAEALKAAGGNVLGVVMTEPMFAGKNAAMGLAAHMKDQTQLARHPRRHHIRLRLRHLQLRILRAPSRLRHGRPPLVPWEREDPLPWNNDHPHHKLLAPLLVRQVQPSQPTDALLFVRVGWRRGFRFWRLLVKSPGRLSIVPLPEREHHGFLYARHAEHMTLFIRRFFRLRRSNP